MVEFSARKQVKKLKLDIGVKLPIHDTEPSYQGFLLPKVPPAAALDYIG